MMLNVLFPKWEIIIIDFNTMVWVCLDQWDLFQCLSCGFCLIKKYDNLIII